MGAKARPVLQVKDLTNMTLKAAVIFGMLEKAFCSSQRVLCSKKLAIIPDPKIFHAASCIRAMCLYTEDNVREGTSELTFRVLFQSGLIMT